MTLWYTSLIAVLSIVFGSFIYLNQSRELVNDAFFRVGKQMEGLIKNMGRGFEIGVREDESFALLDSSGEITQYENMTVQEAGLIEKRFENEPENDPDSTLFPAAKKPAGLRPGRPFAWAKFFVEGGRVYGEMELKPRLDETGEELPSGMLLFSTPLDPYGLSGHLLLTLIVAVSLMLALALLSGIWLANRSMKPVSQIAETARSIGAGDLSRRIKLQSNDELGEIAGVFDEMLDRLEDSFMRQKRFVADAGHELRTPLSIIKLETESALTAERRPDEYRASLELVKTESDYMANLVEDLLCLARIDDSGQHVSRELIDLADIIVDSLERLAPMAAAKNVRLECAELPEAPVMANRAELNKVVSNLLGNAVKYSRPEGGTVSIKLELVPSGSATLSVADTGIGISAEKLPHVFERFYRADESRAENDGIPSGSGLGLSIVKGIVDAEGGAVSIRSEEGKGSTFTVRLPLAKKKQQLE